MNELVFLESMKLDEEPYTTSLVISEFAKIEHHSVTRLIRRYKEDLELFGFNGFHIHKLEGRGRPRKIYHLNEQQATLIITYLDNTEPVRRFKQQLVHQFYSMKEELIRRQVQREQGKATRISLTDAIQQSGISEKYYFHYTNLAYKTSLGYSTKQLRAARGVKNNCSPLDYLSAEELQAINQREQQIATLIMLGMDYEQIKAVLVNGGVIYQTTLSKTTNKLQEA